jgi:hypothetical protein
MNQEIADAIILNAFDKSDYVSSDNANQVIGDKDDYEKSLERYITWDKEKNFVFDGNGNMVGEVLPNPINELPFIDVSGGKDFEYFVRCGQPLIDFTIQYNGALSDLAQLVKMQAFGQAVLATSKDLMPSQLTIGVNKVIHLPIDPNSPVQPKFEFVTAQPDVSGSLSAVENLLSNFLSSRGLDPKLVNGKAETSKYNSGIDRLLSMISDLEASKQDVEVFREVEQKLYELLKAWSRATFGTDGQILSFIIPEDSEIVVKYYEPTMIQSEKEKLENLQLKKELGLVSKKMMIKEYYDMNDDQADEKLEEIESEVEDMISDNME